MVRLDDRDGWIWHNGTLVPWKDAKVHVLTHSLHYGLAIFEGIRAYKTKRGGALFRGEEHTQRFLRSAHIMQIPMNFDVKQLMDAQINILKHNQLTEAYIRPLAFYGSEKLGVTPPKQDIQTIIAAWVWNAYLGEGALEQGVRTKTSSYSRHHINSAMCKSKTSGHYVNSILAQGEALRDGYDEAILLDTQGFVAEGSGENIFLVRDGILYTPTTSSALEGITRDSIIQLAKHHGLTVIEKNITRDECYIADEAFFTGTAAEVTPIREMDNRTIGQGVRGPITQLLQEE
jgi:branched-chain amino acid aminotransferase